MADHPDTERTPPNPAASATRFIAPPVTSVECFEIVQGDLATGALLYAIVRWYMPNHTTGRSKITYCDFGAFWIVKTRLELMQEAGLTLGRYNRALAKLQRRGFIVVEHHKPVKPLLYRAQKVTWIRLVREVCEPLLHHIVDSRTWTSVTTGCHDS